MTYFVQYHWKSTLGSDDAIHAWVLSWRTVDLDRVWRKVQMPTQVECFTLMQQFLGCRPDLQVLVDVTGGDDASTLSPETREAYKAAVAAESLRRTA